MKKASIRLLSAVLAILMLCAIAGCAPSTEDTNSSTEQTTTVNSPNEDTNKDPNEDTNKDPNEDTNKDPVNSTLYENSFDSSANMEGWTNNPAEMPEGSYAKVNDAGQLEIYAATKDATGRSFNLEGYSGKVTFEFDITCSFLETVEGNRTSGAIMVFADGKAAVCFYFYPEGFGYYNTKKEPSPGVTIFGTCNSDQTYHVAINADTDTDTYDVYVDGALILEGAGFRNAGDKLDKIQLSSGGSSVGVTLKYDNLKISKTQASADSTDKTPSDGDSTAAEVLFEHDFADLEGWGTAPAAGLPDGAEVGIVDGALSVYTPTTVSGLASKTHGLNNLSGKIAFEVDVTVNFPVGAPNNKGGAAVIVNTEAGASLAVYIFNGTYGFYDVDMNPKGVNKIGVYTNGTTFKLKLVADTTTDLYDIYIDGEVLIEDVKFRNNGDAFNKIQLGSGATDVGATAIFDNLKIYVAEE